MYKKNIINKTSIKLNTSYKGETIEEKVQRIVNNKEPITDGAPLIYTDRKEGTQPQYNIRTDRWEIAVEAMDKVTKQNIAKRENKPDMGETAKKNMETEKKSENNKKNESEA